jgi:hypothetical protein
MGNREQGTGNREQIRDFQLKKYTITLIARGQGVGIEGKIVVLKRINWIVDFLEVTK